MEENIKEQVQCQPAREEKRQPDCVTRIQDGKNVLVVSGFFSKEGKSTAVDRMMEVLKLDERLKEAVSVNP